MMPAGLLWAIAAVLIVLRVVWWLAANDKICRGTSTHDAGVPIGLADCRVWSPPLPLGCDGGACYLLEHAASPMPNSPSPVPSTPNPMVMKHGSRSVSRSTLRATAMLADMLSTRMSAAVTGLRLSTANDCSSSTSHDVVVEASAGGCQSFQSGQHHRGQVGVRVLIGITAVGGLIERLGSQSVLAQSSLPLHRLTHSPFACGGWYLSCRRPNSSRCTTQY